MFGNSNCCWLQAIFGEMSVFVTQLLQCHLTAFGMYESSVKWIRAQRRPTILLLSCHHCVPPLLCTSFGGLLNNCVALGTDFERMFQ